MADMLKKGDDLRPAYNNFDYEALDSTQLAWVRRMTLYTQYRDRVIHKFEESRVSNDMKILFIEQHSMKLGDRVFYTLESKRQLYLQTLEATPYVGGVFSVCFLVVFAIKTPITSKLYKEAAYSLGLGMACAAQIPLYYRRQYHKTGDDIYRQLNERFLKYPDQAQPDNENVVKNFGMTRWNEGDFNNDEDLEADSAVGVFDGDA